MTGVPAVGSESGNGEELQPPTDVQGAVTDAEAACPDSGLPAASAELPDSQPADSQASSIGAADGAADVPADLDRQLAALRAEHEHLNGQYMRLAADFDNFRKRQARDNEDLRAQIVCSTLSEILPVVDNFERARQQLTPQHEEAQALHRSYQGLYKQLVDVFKQLGVSPMRVEGEPFDPSLHEAVLREESDEHPEDVVVAELQRGYQLNGRVLRHALVKVSMGPGPASSGGAAGPEHRLEDQVPPTAAEA